MSRARSVLLIVALLAIPLSGCSTHYIFNTDVEDSAENRKIISFCERYRNAVLLKDVPALLHLASPDYYEDGGNVDATDDLDYAGLEDYLTHKFVNASGIRYDIRYRRVIKNKNGSYMIDYTFSASYRIPGEKGDEWHRRVDDNRLEIVPYKEEFRVTAGL